MNLIHAATALLLGSNLSTASQLMRGAKSTSRQTKTSSPKKKGHPAKSSKAGPRAKAAKVESWDIVVNNANVIPPPGPTRRNLAEGDDKTFSSYNAASVNENKDVVFRARSTG